MSPTKRQVSDSSSSSADSADLKAILHRGRPPTKKVRPAVSGSPAALASPAPTSDRANRPNSDAASPSPSSSSSPASPPIAVDVGVVIRAITNQRTPPQHPETAATLMNQDGLEWEAGRVGLKPKWVTEPSIEVIEILARKHLSLQPADRCDVVFHAKAGLFHKLFRVIPSGGVGSGYIMRVALPVDPYYQTSSEVATMEYVRSFTTIPIPKVIASDSSNSNLLGFAWILMEFVHGTPLEECWWDLPMAAKERLVKQLAEYQSQLFKKQHGQIGNLLRAPSSPKSSPYSIGPIVHEDFFWGDRIDRTLPRGPFEHSHTWLSARLTHLRLDKQRVLESPDSDEGDREDAWDIIPIVQKLLKLLPSVFPPGKPESTVLFHDDLSMLNTLVDERGVLTAVLGWNCASVLPLWRACKMPDLLRGQERVEPPTPGQLRYCPYDGEINQMYFDQLVDYETTKLRPIFLDEMRRLCPKWVKVMRESKLQREFDNAIFLLDGFADKEIDAWLDSFENGKPGWSIGERFY
ncbi:MAG: hypothetical protein M1826_004568 [Phylliscum demangeonii]|nr:MAG: hypothetical protein M1826_004568 [Phylliscum demangeonii]